MHHGWQENSHEAHCVPAEQMRALKLKEKFEKCQEQYPDQTFILAKFLNQRFCPFSMLKDNAEERKKEPDKFQKVYTYSHTIFLGKK